MPASKTALLCLCLLVLHQGANATFGHSSLLAKLVGLQGGQAPPRAAPTPTTPPYTTPTGPPAPPTAPRAPPPTPPRSNATCQSVAATASANSDLSTLVSVVEFAGLTGLVSSPDLIATVLAPNNAAFAALLATLGVTAEELLVPENRQLVADILTYHVIPGQALRAADLTDGQTLTSALSGETIAVDLSSGVAFKPTAPNAPAARVVTPDVEACRSIIHIIDQVLIPASLNVTGGGEAPPPTSTASARSTATSSADGSENDRTDGTNSLDNTGGREGGGIYTNGGEGGNDRMGTGGYGGGRK